MSSSVLSHIWSLETPKGRDRLMLAILADHAGHDGRVSIPVRELARCAAVSKTTAAEALISLQEAGHISQTSHGGGRSKPSEYRVIMSGHAVAASTLDHDEPVTDESPQHCPVPPPITPFVEKIRAGEYEVRIGHEPGPNSEPTPIPQPPVPSQNLGQAPVNSEASAPVDKKALLEAIVTAAGLQPPKGAPFYWHSRAHHELAREILAAAGGDMSRMVEIISCAPIKPDIRNLGPVLDVVTKAVGRNNG